jgi:hypothetical protein
MFVQIQILLGKDINPIVYLGLKRGFDPRY